MQKLSTIVLLIVMSISSPCTFAIKFSKQTEQQGRDLIEELDKRGRIFQELAGRVNGMMSTIGPQSVFFIAPHLNLMGSSLEAVVSTLTNITTYSKSLEKIIEDDPERKLTQTLKPIAMPGRKPGQTIAIGDLGGDIAIAIGDLGGATGCSLDITEPSFFIAYMQEQEDSQIGELCDNLSHSLEEFKKQALSYKGLSTSLKRYLDEFGTDDVLKIWSDLQQMKQHIDELIKLTNLLSENYDLFMKQVFTHFTAI